MKNMVSNSVALDRCDSVEDAPKYGEEVTMLKIDRVLLVPKGTIEGNPSADITLVDAEGNKYLIMTTGNILEMIGGFASGVRQSE